MLQERLGKTRVKSRGFWFLYTWLNSSFLLVWSFVQPHILITNAFLEISIFMEVDSGLCKWVLSLYVFLKILSVVFTLSCSLPWNKSFKWYNNWKHFYIKQYCYVGQNFNSVILTWRFIHMKVSRQIHNHLLLHLLLEIHVWYL